MTGPDEPGKIVPETRNLAEVGGIGCNVTLAIYQTTGSGVDDHDAVKHESHTSFGFGR
jgi:hypothetical protein